MKHIIILLFGLLPLWSYPQSETEIRLAIRNCNYEIPIQQIPAACGDSILTPMRAQALKAMNRHAEALQEWNSLLKEDSTDTSILMELAECYKSMNRTRNVIDCYRKAVSLRPENQYFFQQYTRSLLTAERF